MSSNPKRLAIFSRNLMGGGAERALINLAGKAMFRNEEIINSDHRYWFSPYTICKILYNSGLNVERIQMCQFSDTQAIWKKYLLNKYPLLSDTIVDICDCN